MHGSWMISSALFTFVLANPISTDLDILEDSNELDDVAFYPVLPDVETGYSA